MRPICPDCDWVHVPSRVVAVGKFDPAGPRGYRAPGGPMRATRIEAEVDLCRATIPAPATPEQTDPRASAARAAITPADVRADDEEVTA